MHKKKNRPVPVSSTSELRALREAMHEDFARRIYARYGEKPTEAQVKRRAKILMKDLEKHAKVRVV